MSTLIHFSHLIHRGLQSTLDALRHRFFYLGMAGDLRARILTCGQCYVSRLRSPLANKYVPEKQSILTKGLCSFNDLVFADTSGRLVREAPNSEKCCSNGNPPNSVSTPPLKQTDALWELFSPKICKFFKTAVLTLGNDILTMTMVKLCS